MYTSRGAPDPRALLLQPPPPLCTTLDLPCTAPKSTSSAPINNIVVVIKIVTRNSVSLNSSKILHLFVSSHNLLTSVLFAWWFWYWQNKHSRKKICHHYFDLNIIVNIVIPTFFSILIRLMILTTPGHISVTWIWGTWGESWFWAVKAVPPQQMTVVTCFFVKPPSSTLRKSSVAERGTWEQ